MCDWMDKARIAAAQCWYYEETKHKEVDIVLAEIIARRIAYWMMTAVENQRNADYYRDLLVQCGESIGDRAFIADDGTRSDSIICAKIPEIIKEDYTHSGN